MTKILVVDDHELIRCGISRLLDDRVGMNVVGLAASGEEAVAFVKQHDVDVVLMDIHMPGMGGLEATRKILRHDKDIRIIAITANEENPYASRLMQAGACGYITKGAGAAEMETAIRKVCSGQKYISQDLAQQLALKPFQPDQASPFDELSERELQIARLIVECHNAQAIADMLFLSSKTVNSYRYRIFQKLDISGDVELTRLAMRHGMIDVTQ